MIVLQQLKSGLRCLFHTYGPILSPFSTDITVIVPVVATLWLSQSSFHQCVHQWLAGKLSACAPVDLRRPARVNKSAQGLGWGGEKWNWAEVEQNRVMWRAGRSGPNGVKIDISGTCQIPSPFLSRIPLSRSMWTWHRSRWIHGGSLCEFIVAPYSRIRCKMSLYLEETSSRQKSPVVYSNSCISPALLQYIIAWRFTSN